MMIKNKAENHTMPLFFLPNAEPEDGILTLRAEDSHHIALSLRMACGDEITVSNGGGTLYACTLESITPDEVRARVCSSAPTETEPPYRLTLYQAVPKNDKLELIVQKAVELGATEIVPFVSSFCVKRPHEDKWQKQSARLARIAEEAAKQCKRGCIPTVAPLLDYEEMLDRAAEADLSLFCYEGEGTLPLPSCLPNTPPSSIAVVIGSEGGFSAKEAEAARAHGLCLCGLGKRILRCETAPLFALSSLSFRYEIL